MPIGFNLAPAGLAAILGNVAGDNEAKKAAILRAMQQQEADRSFSLQADQANLAHQQADRSYDLSQAQLARQSQQDQMDNFLRAQEVQGRLASLYSDQADKSWDQQFRASQAMDNSNLQRQELAQRGEDAKSRNALTGRELDLREKQSQQQADQFNQTMDYKQQSNQNQLDLGWAKLDGQWSANDQRIAQLDRASQARTQAAAASLQSRSDRDSISLQLKQHAAGIDSAEAQYNSLRKAAADYQDAVKNGLTSDTYDASMAKMASMASQVDSASKAVEQAHTAYQAFLDTAAGGNAAPATAPAPAAGGQVPASVNLPPGAIVNPDGTVTYGGYIYRRAQQ